MNLSFERVNCLFTGRSILHLGFNMKTFNVRCQSGQTFNSLTVEQVKSLAARGLITSEDEINLDGSDKWVAAAKVKGLFPPTESGNASAPEPPAPPPPSPSSNVADQLAEVDQAEIDASALEEQEEESLNTPLGLGGIALGAVGVAYFCLAAADFLLYNLEIWDFYAAIDLGWMNYFTAIIAGAVGSMLTAAGTRRVGLPAPVQWVLFSFASLFLMIIVGSSLLSGGDNHLNIVRYGALDACPTSTLDELANATLSEPEWESLIADDGYAYVNLSGGVTYGGLPAQALLQFRVEGDDFFFNAIEINGVPQNQFIANELIDLLCSGR